MNDDGNGVSIGTEIVLLGTKCGKVDYDWKAYFGNCGRTYGTKEKINLIVHHGQYHYFSLGTVGTSSGFMLRCDFVLVGEPFKLNWRKRYSQ